MLNKVTIDKNDWDLYLPLVLFAYRQTPHSVTGFSPFQLIYCFIVRIDGGNPDSSLVVWVEHLKHTLADFSVVACERSALSKLKMKQ